MTAQLVLDYYFELYNTLGNTLSDIDFSNLSFLQEREPIYNMKGQKVSKSYVCPEGIDAVRITYNRTIGDYTYNQVVYPDVFLGLQKTIHYLDLDGKIRYSKTKKFYSFDLQPVFLGDGTETVVGFSSQKQREILKTERFKADDYLASKNPQLYAMLYASYGSEYNAYLRTGLKDSFVNKLNSETNPELLAVLNNQVYGYEPMTIKELIIMNLQ